MPGYHPALQAWVAETGDELPFEQAAERLERLAGIGLGIETVRTHTEQVGSALAERQRAAAATVAQTQEAAGPLDTAPELLVVEVDGVDVRFQDGWHEAKVGEIAGCQVGNGLPDADPAARRGLVAPTYVASRSPVGEFGSLFLAESGPTRGVLPQPPAPVRVTSRAPASRTCTSDSTRSRPMKLVSGVGRLCPKDGP